MVVSCFKAHADNQSFVRNGIQYLSAIIQVPGSKDEILRCGGIDTICSAIATYSNDEVILDVGSGLLKRVITPILMSASAAHLNELLEVLKAEEDDTSGAHAMFSIRWELCILCTFK